MSLHRKADWKKRLCDLTVISWNFTTFISTGGCRRWLAHVLVCWECTAALRVHLRRKYCCLCTPAHWLYHQVIYLTGSCRHYTACSQKTGKTYISPTVFSLCTQTDFIYELHVVFNDRASPVDEEGGGETLLWVDRDVWRRVCFYCNRRHNTIRKRRLKHSGLRITTILATLASTMFYNVPLVLYLFIEGVWYTL